GLQNAAAPVRKRVTNVKYENPKKGLRGTIFDVIDKGTGTSGNVGTEGTNNFGARDQGFHHVVKDWQDSEQGSVTSGVSDMASAFSSTAALSFQLAKAIDTVRDNSRPESERTQAAVDIAATVTALVQSLCVAEGGVLTALEGTGRSDLSSNFGFTAEGGNMLSTDFKLVGDAAGMLADVLGLVSSAIEAVNNYKKLVKGSKAEAVGRVSLTIAKGLGQLAKTAKTLGQFIGQ